MTFNLCLPRTDGPCSIGYSRLKFSEGGSNSLTPSELVNRHKKYIKIVVVMTMCHCQFCPCRVLSVAVSNGDSSRTTERAWGHVQSLYQSKNAMCLFGKNSILVKLVCPLYKLVSLVLPPPPHSQECLNQCGDTSPYSSVWAGSWC